MSSRTSCRVFSDWCNLKFRQISNRIVQFEPPNHASIFMFMLVVLLQGNNKAIKWTERGHCCGTNDSFHFEGKTRGAFTLPKGARNVFLNESEDSRNVLGESQRVCERWTSVKDRDFAATENPSSPSGLSFISLQVHNQIQLFHYSGEYFLLSNSSQSSNCCVSTSDGCE